MDTNGHEFWGVHRLHGINRCLPAGADNLLKKLFE